VIEYKYSTFWPRFWAGCIDGLIFMPLGWIHDWAFPHLSIPLRVIAFLIVSTAFVIYEIWMLGRFGQTLGKMVCKVVVLDVSEGPLSFRQAALRDIFDIVLVVVGLVINIPLILDGVDISVKQNSTPIDFAIAFGALGLFAIELITMFTNNKRRALHDYIAGSVVVRQATKDARESSNANARA
jgi:uncharacterized RDD family membrane protein YckC